ncbi:Bifunctional NAD(P)H-hydrate repair enzyme Nnr [bacterium HR15]|nr:Bifunctional NAD(P)H-hydrate repair enzyme Nnr [bacterium HR15]
MRWGTPIVSAAEMRALDRATIEEDGVPSLILMERAGQGVFRHLCEWFSPIQGRRVAIIVGKGNNGGDGLVVARYLHEAGASVHLWLATDPSEFTGDAAVQWHIVRAYDIPALPIPPNPDPALFREEEVLVDALLGTGLQGEVREPYRTLIEVMNQSERPIVAVDIPSGLDADTGRELGIAIRATYTVTMALPKLGFFQNAGPRCVGKWVAVPIGIVPRRMADLQSAARLLNARDIGAMLPAWSPDAHKGHRGHVLVVGGSPGMVGAPALAGISALRVGAGLATVATPARIQPQVASFYPELMTIPLPDGDTGALTRDGVRYLSERWARYDVLALGPGLGQLAPTESAIGELLSLWSQRERPLVIDADGLNWMARLGGEVPLPPWTVLTPHPGEAARLLQIATHQVQEDRLNVAALLHERYGATIVLKGAYSVITDGSDTWIVPFAEPSLATGGSGDVLTGAIAGLLAQGLAPREAALAGAYLHAAAGATLACEGHAPYTADELSRALINALRSRAVSLQRIRLGRNQDADCE